MKFNREKRVEQSSVDCHDWIIFFGNKLMEHHCLVRLAKNTPIEEIYLFSNPFLNNRDSDLMSIGSSDSRNYEMADVHGVKSMCYQSVASSTGGGKMSSVVAAAALKSATATVVAGYPSSDTEMFASDYPSHHLHHHHHHPHQHHYSNNNNSINNNNNNHLSHLYHNHHHQMLQPIPQTSAASHS
ncbi:hypothetical protein QTP88_019130 [Uroleucon formosanum]